uniref:Uncharacterized protein n=1 Tax=Sexangularia sp. CB-2014 TaxID=1486929 RepID=A0A7S1V5I9_9EUKA|mmetsp:Transcript_12059/g.38293  ORF Transcript_12059/g.38293 Transcript_12059/m.38293 type:complete len:173 (+) Transcript_12059:109-627(+)
MDNAELCTIPCPSCNYACRGVGSTSYKCWFTFVPCIAISSAKWYTSSSATSGSRSPSAEAFLFGRDSTLTTCKGTMLNRERIDPLRLARALFGWPEKSASVAGRFSVCQSITRPATSPSVGPYRRSQALHRPYVADLRFRLLVTQDDVVHVRPTTRHIARAPCPLVAAVSAE